MESRAGPQAPQRAKGQADVATCEWALFHVPQEAVRKSVAEMRKLYGEDLAEKVMKAGLGFCMA